MKVIFSLLFVFFTCAGNAQSDDVTFTLGVLPVVASTEFDQVQINKIEIKLLQLLNNSHEAIAGFTTDFFLYPAVSIEESGVADGGLQGMVVTTLDLSVFLKQTGSEMIYNSISIKLKGIGNTGPQSITNAITKLGTQDTKFNAFIKDGKEKVLKYYYENCDAIVQQANTLGLKHDYERAISMLESIPSSTSCYDEAHKKSTEFYMKYQSTLCAKNILIAKSEISVNNYDRALDALAVIDPEASCAGEANKLIEQISNKTDKKEKKEYSLEVQRINAIKAIASNYNKNKTKSKKD